MTAKTCKRPILIIDGEIVRFREDGLTFSQDTEIDTYKSRMSGIVYRQIVPGSQRISFVDNSHRRREFYIKESHREVSNSGRVLYCVKTHNS